jgi:hypothetical protein
MGSTPIASILRLSGPSGSASYEWQAIFLNEFSLKKSAPAEFYF